MSLSALFLPGPRLKQPFPVKIPVSLVFPLFPSNDDCLLVFSSSLPYQCLIFYNFLHDKTLSDSSILEK